MDIQTIEFYSNNYKSILSTYRAAGAGISKYFDLSFLHGSSVLDIGFGSGRDLSVLISKGFKAEGVDSCPEFIDSATDYYPELKGLVSKDSLPVLETIGDNCFDGILCSAVLMHLPEELLFDSIYSIRRVLKKNGRLVISIPVDKFKGNRDEQGRLFNGVTPDNFQLIFERIGFRLINKWNDDDSLGREKRRWSTLLFSLEAIDGIRSLDKIEGVLNKDKKNATYKLALFRALAELAMTSYNSALWLPNGRVALPLKLISEKWLQYYWPIFESKEFIPQKRGESPGCQQPVAFRKSLERVIDGFQNMGNLPGFSIAFRNGELPKGLKGDVKKLIAKLNSTIIKGPVYYSGGSDSNTFEYNKTLKSVEMDAGIWRELSIMGAWIIDATILRWAELTSEISLNKLRPSRIIDYLLVNPIPERDTKAARAVFEKLSGKDCVWSGKGLLNDYDIDHVIPFALWKNNDLWNLLPADSKVNNNKRDKLPAYDLLATRKDSIIYYWTKLRNEYTIRFDYEAEKFAQHLSLKSNNWENKLFSSLKEAVEITAIQRGVSRWRPKGFIVSERPKVKIKKYIENQKTFSPEIIAFPSKEKQYVSCVPFYDLKATAGRFDNDQFLEEAEEHADWIKVDNKKLEKEMFVIEIIGHSMEPVINDGDYCLFRGGSALGGSRQGRIVLAQHRSASDPNTNLQLTVKKYYSEKKYDENGNPEHVCIKLIPINQDYDPIIIEQVAHEGEFRIIAEFVGKI